MSNKKPIIGILVLIIYMIFPVLLGLFIPTIGNSNNLQLIIRMLFNIFVIFLFIFLYKDVFKTDFYKFKESPFKTILKSCGYAILIILFLALVNGLLFLVLFPNLTLQGRTIIDEYLNKNVLFILLNLFLYVPIVETIIFRKAFKDIIGNNWFYILFSGLVFGFCSIGYHITGYENIVEIVPYFVIGGIYSYSYFKTDNIYIPILTNIIYNFYVFMLFLPELL